MPQKWPTAGEPAARRWRRTDTHEEAEHNEDYSEDDECHLSAPCPQNRDINCGRFQPAADYPGKNADYACKEQSGVRPLGTPGQTTQVHPHILPDLDLPFLALHPNKGVS
jgi:hypothetical protein